MFIKITLLAFLYFAVGKLSLLLAIPPGYATAIWPSAGIALAFVLRYGFRIWPGVLIGSFFINIGTAYNPQSTETIVQSVFLAMMIGAGASLQAVFGAYIIRQRVSSLGLVTPKDIVQFFLFGGLIASAISPTFGVFTLVVTNVISLDTSGTSWITWWIGDAIGVFLFTPFMFLWIGRPRDVWKTRRYFLISPLIIISVIITGIIHFGYRAEQARQENVFENRTNDFVRALEYKVREYYSILSSFRGFYESSQFVDHKEFQKYAANLLPNFQYVKSVAWTPKILKQEKESFLESVRQERIPDYYIKDILPEGGFKEAGDREVYFPVLYIEPLPENQKVLGIDNASEPGRRQAMEIAMRTGMYGASSPITLAQDQAIGVKSVLLIVPVNKKEITEDTPKAEFQNIEGFVSITIRAEDVLKGTLRISSLENIGVVITDVDTSGFFEVFNNTSVNDASVDKILHLTRTLNMAGRQWNIEFFASPGFYTEFQNLNLWFIVTGALLLATLLNLLLLVITGQTVQVRREVYTRTTELETEINKHRLTEQELKRRRNELEDAHTASLNIMKDALEAQSKAEEAEQKSRQALNIKSEFTSMVSHELRTPLTVIKESVAIVYDGTAGAISDDQKDFLETAKRNVDRLGRLINDVLDYQKLESQQMEFRMAPHNINSLVKETGEGFRTPLKNKGVDLVFKLDPDLPDLTVDSDKIIQVLINLINNAMKFTEKGRVVLTTEKLGDNMVKVSVKDSGMGIKDEDKHKLFKSFSQISTGSTRKTGGTGLGLVLCKKIIECHNGKIEVDSVFGEGSVFYFILPIVDRRSRA